MKKEHGRLIRREDPKQNIEKSNQRRTKTMVGQFNIRKSINIINIMKTD